MSVERAKRVTGEARIAPFRAPGELLAALVALVEEGRAGARRSSRVFEQRFAGSPAPLAIARVALPLNDAAWWLLATAIAAELAPTEPLLVGAATRIAAVLAGGDAFAPLVELAPGAPLRMLRLVEIVGTARFHACELRASEAALALALGTAPAIALAAGDPADGDDAAIDHALASPGAVVRFSDVGVPQIAAVAARAGLPLIVAPLDREPGDVVREALLADAAIAAHRDHPAWTLCGRGVVLVT